MKEASLKRIMTLVMFIGLALVLVAIYLAVFAQLHNSMGMKGIKIIAGVAGAGLVLLLPSKVFLTLLLMMSAKK